MNLPTSMAPTLTCDSCNHKYSLELVTSVQFEYHRDFGRGRYGVATETMNLCDWCRKSNEKAVSQLEGYGDKLKFII